MTTLQEYDKEIKPAKIVWGQGLCQMGTEVVAEEVWEDETVVKPKSIQFNDISESWYTYMKHYLSTGHGRVFRCMQAESTAVEVNKVATYLWYFV